MGAPGKLRCRLCGEALRNEGDDMPVSVDRGDPCCERRYDECPACQDGEAHPHDAVLDAGPTPEVER